ncbi:hypothetical protein [Labilibacter marinus]|uniref:hypothetical protein n=1 Tax=Labilibacter marinus TaxID=1477105 RepID=UPI00094FDC6F|nr:hypothetical protein [Labilibacter marinus]
MKKIVLALICAVFIWSGLTSVSAQKSKKSKEMFREESMRKFTVSNTTVQLEKGTMWVYDYGETKVHAYETKDFFGTYVFILEKNGEAVLLETPPVKDNYEELIDYIVGLGHASIDLILSYHPIGAEFIKTDKLKFTNIYSMQHAVDNYVSGPGAPSLIGLKERFGEAMDVSIYEPTLMLEEGEIEIVGMKFILKNIDFAFSVEIPEINAVHLHMLGADRHTMVFNYEFADSLINLLKGFQKAGYDMYFSSHAEPETTGAVTQKIKYLEDLNELL